MSTNFFNSLHKKDNHGNVTTIPYKTIEYVLEASPQGDNHLKLRPAGDIGE